jgi:hypothetical protein
MMRFAVAQTGQFTGSKARSAEFFLPRRHFLFIVGA